ncbi:DUF1302 family protein [Spongiibacter thalassae]|uniref:DUF1302 family protein n=1 Tax=Spongiibacter thalassae TaxID=2721624 RepID=UPI001B2FE9A9|nr:DUF1302 family protein [Spongiibacter thalassae]
MKKTYRRVAPALLVSLGGLLASHAQAESGIQELWDRTTFLGQIRLDAAYKTNDEQNPYNQNAFPFQDVAVERQAYLPPDLGGGSWGAVPLMADPLGLIPTNDTIRRDDRVYFEDYETNQLNLRFSGEMDMRFNREWRMNVKMRAIFDPVVHEGFNAGMFSNDQGGIASGGGDRYADTGETNFYEAKSRTGENLNPFEVAGRDYMVDFPTFILNYKSGKYDLRFGLQQIAWGQAVFFRTFDVANSLDLRRHLILDRGIEEFEDERVPKLALRGTVQATRNVIFDAYIGKFQPDILPNPNTPYNVVPSQFYKPLDNYHSGGYDNKLDAGFRLKGDYGNWSWQAMAVSRYNPLGVFSWAESGIEKGLSPWGGSVGAAVEAAYLSKPQCQGEQNPYDNFCRLYGSVGEALGHTPFTVGPGGVYSDKEWFSTAASVRLHGVDVLNRAIADFPALRDVFASPVNNVEEASALLNTFFIGAGGSIRGNVERDYYREDVFGLGLGYVTSTEDVNSFWDQIILNLEVQYAPERRFTSPDLSQDGIETDEVIVTLVAEKWYRWTESFPAAYLVGQFMHRSESDLVGLHLSGYGGNVGNTDPKLPEGIDSANYLVFAGFQPWPNRKFIAEWAFLYDVEGGLLAQPLIKWNPGRGMSVDLYYNYVTGDLHGDGTSTLTRAIDHVEEVGMRFTYQL